jgi:hypothetical protein
VVPRNTNTEIRSRCIPALKPLGISRDAPTRKLDKIAWFAQMEWKTHRGLAYRMCE